MHTMSKAIYDQNIFYTSDSELMLKFELIEKEFSYDSGEILLFNETDKSFVTRGISKVDDGFVYQIESDIIQHHGEWVGQLQLVKNGEVYTSKPFKFTIENDLSSVSPPQLIDINSWATLKQSAIDLIDDMQNVIGEYDEAAVDFQQAENVRMNNETDRKQAESTRQNHETIRQNQERVRERNEVERKSNEVTREENETVRIQAEQERQSAESSRVSAEGQRKIDHANRSDELDGKADKKQEDWIAPTLLNGATSGDVAPQYRKDEFGVVRLSGSISDVYPNQVLFVLPSGYRPKGMLNLPTLHGQYYNRYNDVIRILANGNVTCWILSKTTDTKNFILDGITFVAEG